MLAKLVVQEMTEVVIRAMGGIEVVDKVAAKAAMLVAKLAQAD